MELQLNYLIFIGIVFAPQFTLAFVLFLFGYNVLGTFAITVWLMRVIFKICVSTKIIEVKK